MKNTITSKGFAGSGPLYDSLGIVVSGNRTCINSKNELVSYCSVSYRWGVGNAIMSSTGAALNICLGGRGNSSPHPV